MLLLLERQVFEHGFFFMCTQGSGTVLGCELAKVRHQREVTRESIAWHRCELKVEGGRVSTEKL